MTNAPFPTTRFEGKVPKRFYMHGVARIERVVGATALFHGHVRYPIANETILRFDRGPDRQFLVVEIGSAVEFESENDEVFIAGTIVNGTGGVVEAKSCIFAREVR